ncbi:MAG: DUF1573 domain-containing protein [Saprospiraceae bacterium]|nr:DUF1573 domain-containing protein [Saprospiraceae bacterium]
MQRLFVLLFSAILWGMACHSTKEARPASAPTPPSPPPVAETPPVVPPPAPAAQTSAFVTWDKKFIDLGAVKRGEKRTMFFEFTNTSGENVQIDLVDACECTKVEYPRRAIEPGQKGRLDVTFDSTEKEKAETIRITIVFKNTHANGLPRIEVVEYGFEVKN